MTTTRDYSFHGRPRKFAGLTMLRPWAVLIRQFCITNPDGMFLSKDQFFLFFILFFTN